MNGSQLVNDSYPEPVKGVFHEDNPIFTFTYFFEAMNTERIYFF